MPRSAFGALKSKKGRATVHGRFFKKAEEKQMRCSGLIFHSVKQTKKRRIEAVSAAAVIFFELLLCLLN